MQRLQNQLLYGHHLQQNEKYDLVGRAPKKCPCKGPLPPLRHIHNLFFMPICDRTVYLQLVKRVLSRFVQFVVNFAISSLPQLCSWYSLHWYFLKRLGVQFYTKSRVEWMRACSWVGLSNCLSRRREQKIPSLCGRTLRGHLVHFAPWKLPEIRIETFGKCPHIRGHKSLSSNRGMICHPGERSK